MRQKLQELENQDPEQGRWGRSTWFAKWLWIRNDDFEPENEQLDEETMIHLYCNEWIDDLHWWSHVSYNSFAPPPGHHSTFSIDSSISADCRIGWKKWLHSSRLACNIPGKFWRDTSRRYQHTSVLWQNEELNKKASAFLRANKAVKGCPNMKIASFARWVNEELLPNHALEPGYPCKLSQETVRKWLHELGFCVLDSKKALMLMVTSSKMWPNTRPSLSACSWIF